MPNGHAYTRTIHTDANGRAMLKQWCILGLATFGRVAVPPDLILTRGSPTRVGKCSVSFAITLLADPM